jgi:hypothetical protein
MTNRRAGRWLFALVLAASCAKTPATFQNEVLVIVVIQVPADVPVEKLRFRKLSSGRASSREADAGAGMPASLDDVSTGVWVPTDGKEVKFEAQALGRGLVLAQGSLTLTASPESSGEPSAVVLPLTRCLPGVVASSAFTPCQTTPDGSAPPPIEPIIAEAPPEVPDGGGETGDVPEVGLDAQPACMEPADGGPPPIVRPAVVRPECESFCQVMQSNCPQVYQTSDRCLFACEELAWPAKSTMGGESTIECRRDIALSAATLNDPIERHNRCLRASIDSVNACGRSCRVYCSTGARVCDTYFPKAIDCESDCYTAMTQIERGTNEFYYAFMLCRFQVLERAVFDRSLCSQAAPNNTCGTCARLALPINY